MASRSNRIFGLPLAIGILLNALPAVADSDGYFCAAEDYLAFELRSFSTPGISGDHVLKVVRFNPKDGVSWGGEVSLDDFQVHEMECQANRVHIAGWDVGYISYVIEISDPERLKIVDHVQDAQQKFNANESGPEPRNLGTWAQPGTMPLESSDPQHSYQLVFTDSPKQRHCAIDHQMKTELQQIGGRGNVTQRLVIFEGIFTETGCD